MKQRFYFLFAFIASSLLSCASQAPLKGTSGSTSKNASGFFIVDCLLPGQVRKLGQMATYLTSRQPIKTTASDCEIRGGEYVAYDRANYGTALKIWLPRAQAGDPEAQAYVGEVYERGLGLAPDYAMAAQWYQKAAAQGNSRAQINLGFLYEKGLGVPKDKSKAMEWYRKSSGLGKTDIPYAATLNVAEESPTDEEIGFLKSELKNSQNEVKNLLQKLQETQKQLQQQSSQTASQQTAATTEIEKRYQQQIRELEHKLSEAEKNTRKIAGELENNQSSTEISSLKLKLQDSENRTQTLLQELQQTRQQLKSQQSSQSEDSQAVARLEQEYRQQIEALEGKLTETEKRAQQIAEELGNNHSASASAQRELLNTQAKLAAMEKRLLQFKKTSQSASTEKAQQQAQIAQLEKEKSQLETQLKSLQQVQVQVVSAKPSIEIIDPPFVQVRGKPTVKLRSAISEREIVGKVKANAGLLSLLVNDRKNSVDEQGLFHANVAIRQGETPVSVVAVDKKGGRSSLDFVFSLSGASQTSTEVASSATSAPAVDRSWQAFDFGNYHALIIGNNKYEKVPSLDTPINDAKAVDRVLRQKYGFNTRLLLNANRYQILSALNEYRAQLTENDNLLVYYAGHGELDKVNMRGHWLPVDADVDNTANWISTVAVTDILNTMSVKHIMVVADSCYSGAMTRSSIARIDAGISEAKKAEWLKAMLKARSRTVLTSGGLKPVMDGGGGDHSVFASAFIKALNDNSNLLEGQSLYRLVSSGIIAIAAGYGIEQVPIYAPIRHAGHESGEFFFVPKI